MRNNNNIPQGYKDSPLGVIPQDWEVSRLGEIGSILTGSTPPTSDVNNYGDNYNFVSPADLTDQKFITRTEKMLSEKGFSISRPMPKGSVLFTCIGSTIGKCGIAYYNLTSNQQINAIICNESNCEFVYYMLKFKSDKIKLLAGEQAVPIINKTQFSNISIAIPPLAEQKRIAEVLGCWDMAIEKQSDLVNALTGRKRALMQQLLTARKRLHNFTAPWQDVKLGEVTKRLTRKNSEQNTNVMTISAQKGFVPQTDFFNKSIASSVLDNYYLVHKDEFCYNKSYSNGYPMGAIKRLNNADKAVVTTLYICFKIDSGICIDFMEHLFESGILNERLMKVANEGGRAHGLLNVTPSDFFSLKLTMPTNEEQKAIAQILTTADQEIESAKNKLKALRTQKRGLMQQLLTGKKRLKT